MSTDPGLRPIQSRRYPVWWWGFELIARLEARASRRLPEHLRCGLEPVP